MKKDKLKIGLTIGDINGIGAELIIKAFSDKRLFNHCIPILYASPNILAYYKKVLQNEQLNYQTVQEVNRVREKTLNIIRIWNDEINIAMGKHDPNLDQFALKSIENAISDLKEKKIDALVTLPVNKSAFQLTTERFEGHTELLASRLEAKDNLMMMVCERLTVALATVHIPVANVAESLTIEGIFRKAKLLNQSLKYDFGIDKPKIAILSLNPHAGDNGIIGNEEINIINPAIEEMKKEKMIAYGPFPADGIFGSGNYLKFDGLLAMYHDQGLAPFKLISNSESGGVNFTAGMDYVRTSPDHGPAYEIVGKGIAKTESFIQAIYMAVDIAHKRAVYAEIHNDPIKKANIKEATIEE